nr:MAG TPA: hypothetical protein [Herelleviridae sp.]
MQCILLCLYGIIICQNGLFFNHFNRPKIKYVN